MKRIIESAVLLSVIFALTGCQQLQSIAQNQQVQQVLTTVLQSVTATQGTTYNFSGSATGAYAMASSDGGKNFLYLDEKNIKNTLSLTLPVTIGTTAAINFPAMTVNGVNFPATTVSGLSVSTSSTSSTISVGDNTGADGTLTVNGTQYPIYNIVADGVTVTDSNGKKTLKASTLQLWYGTPETKLYVVNYAYSGTAQ